MDRDMKNLRKHQLQVQKDAGNWKPEKEVYDLNTTKDWKSSKEAHSASDQAKLRLKCHLILNGITPVLL